MCTQKDQLNFTTLFLMKMICCFHSDINELLAFLTGKFNDNASDNAAWKVSKYDVISGPYFPVFSPSTGKYGSEITPFLDTFHILLMFESVVKYSNFFNSKLLWKIDYIQYIHPFQVRAYGIFISLIKSICCKIFKVCLTILGHHALKG